MFVNHFENTRMGLKLTQADWRCPVCHTSNLAKSNICQLCSSPVGLSGKEIESRRADWKNSEGAQPSHSFKFGLASKLALFLVADIVVSFVFTSLVISGGGNAIGAGLVGFFLLFPAPFLLLAWIVVVGLSLWKGK